MGLIGLHGVCAHTVPHQAWRGGAGKPRSLSLSWACGLPSITGGLALRSSQRHGGPCSEVWKAGGRAAETPGGAPRRRAGPQGPSRALDDGVGVGDVFQGHIWDPRCWVFLLGQRWAQDGSSGLRTEPALGQPQSCEDRFLIILVFLFLFFFFFSPQKNRFSC